MLSADSLDSLEVVLDSLLTNAPSTSDDSVVFEALELSVLSADSLSVVVVSLVADPPDTSELSVVVVVVSALDSELVPSVEVVVAFSEVLELTSSVDSDSVLLSLLCSLLLVVDKVSPEVVSSLVSLEVESLVVSVVELSSFLVTVSPSTSSELEEVDFLLDFDLAASTNRYEC